MKRIPNTRLTPDNILFPTFVQACFAARRGKQPRARLGEPRPARALTRRAVARRPFEVARPAEGLTAPIMEQRPRAAGNAFSQAIRAATDGTATEADYALLESGWFETCAHFGGYCEFIVH